MAVDWASVRHFREHEFQCRCSCGSNQIQPGLIYKLDDLRAALGAPVNISSGYRCPAHNDRVSSTGIHGPHTTGLAADVRCHGPSAHQIIKLALAAGFTGIGISQKGDPATRFVHLDMIPDSHSHRRPWIWSY